MTAASSKGVKIAVSSAIHSDRLSTRLQEPSWEKERAAAGKFGDYPLFEELLPINPNGVAAPPAELQKGFEIATGWWLCQFFGTAATEDVLCSLSPIIFQLEVASCPQGFIRVIGRHYNMTVNEVKVDSLTNGIVSATNPRFFSNLMCPVELSAVDTNVCRLVHGLTVVKYRPEDDSLVLSDGTVTAVATRSPQ